MVTERILHGIYFHGLKLSPLTLAHLVTYYQKPEEASHQMVVIEECLSIHSLNKEARGFLPYTHLCHP